MLVFGAPYPSAGGGGGGGPIDPATLFGGGRLGAYYDFTDPATLAVNADGTGGTPAIGAACRSVLDLSGNGNRLRNTISSVTRRAEGVETSGTNYGLFNMGGFGDFPDIAQPFEVIFCLEQIAYAAPDAKLGAGLLQGAASGEVRFFTGGYSTAFSPGLGAEFIIDGYFDASLSTVALNGAAMVASPTSGGGAMQDLAIGSGTGSEGATQLRAKYLLIIKDGLTSGQRAGVIEHMQA